MCAAPNGITLPGMQTSVIAPGLLLAAPPLGDPNFSQAVVLVASHNEEGSLGWVLNGREIAPLQGLLHDAGLIADGTQFPTTASYRGWVRVGGPVSPRSAWVVYRGGDELDHEGRVDLTGGWSGTGHRVVIDAIAKGHGPPEFRLMLGYAGWGQGQLEQEIGAGLWLPVKFEPQVVFGGSDDEMWQRSFEQLAGVSPLAFGGMRGGVA